MRKGWMTFVLPVFAALLMPAGPRAQNAGHEHYVSPWKTAWTYERADHWSELDPQCAACNDGKEQSPIDIRTAQRADLPALRFEYKIGPLKYVTNNDHTIRVNYPDAPENGDFLIVGDQRYQLTQLHFHHPSEEYIHGKPYEMEVHLMHEAPDGKVAGVAVFLKAGSSNVRMGPFRGFGIICQRPRARTRLPESSLIPPAFYPVRPPTTDRGARKPLRPAPKGSRGLC